MSTGPSGRLAVKNSKCLLTTPGSVSCCRQALQTMAAREQFESDRRLLVRCESRMLSKSVGQIRHGNCGMMNSTKARDSSVVWSAKVSPTTWPCSRFSSGKGTSRWAEGYDVIPAPCHETAGQHSRGQLAEDDEPRKAREGKSKRGKTGEGRAKTGVVRGRSRVWIKPGVGSATFRRNLLLTAFARQRSLRMTPPQVTVVDTHCNLSWHEINRQSKRRVRNDRRPELFQNGEVWPMRDVQ